MRPVVELLLGLSGVLVTWPDGRYEFFTLSGGLKLLLSLWVTRRWDVRVSLSSRWYQAGEVEDD